MFFSGKVGKTGVEIGYFSDFFREKRGKSGKKCFFNCVFALVAFRLYVYLQIVARNLAFEGFL